MNKILLFVLLWICTTGTLFSKDHDVLLLEGTIGKAQIVMEITFSEDGLGATYFYKKYKKSIDLEGKFIDPETMELVYELWGEPKESFRLKDIGKGTSIIYSGSWKNLANNTTLPVTLKPIDISKIQVKNTFVKTAKLNAIDYVRLADVVLKEDTVIQQTEEIITQWYSNSYNNFKLFRIAAKGKLKVDSINKELEQLQYGDLLSYFTCSGRTGDASEYFSDTRSVYVRNHILSFAISTSYDCGGAHPDFGVIGYTYNLETGKAMEITDFLYFGKTRADFPKDEDYKFAREVLAPNLVKLLKQLYPKEMTPSTNEDEAMCDYSDEDVWDYSPWYLTEEGLYLYPYFYRAARACDGADFSFIPYAVLKKYKNPSIIIPMTY